MAQGVYLIGRARGANRSGAGVEGGTGRNTLYSAWPHGLFDFEQFGAFAHCTLKDFRIDSRVVGVRYVCRPRWERTGTAYTSQEAGFFPPKTTSK